MNFATQIAAISAPVITGYFARAQQFRRFFALAPLFSPSALLATFLASANCASSPNQLITPDQTALLPRTAILPVQEMIRTVEIHWR